MNRNERRAAKTGRFAGGDARLDGAEVKFGGRTLSIQVVINTDEPLEAVVARLRQTARGPQNRMVVFLGGEMPIAETGPFWEKVFDTVERGTRTP